MAETTTSRRDDLPFDELMAIHRGAGRGHMLFAALLLLAGVALLALGLLGTLPWLPALVVGIVVLAVTVFPYREMVERQERVEGLAVLRDEWRDIAKGAPSPKAEQERFTGLLWRLYSADKSIS